MSLQLVKGYMVSVCLHVLFFLVAAVSARCNHHRNCQLNIATPVSCSPFLWSLCRRMTCRKNRSTCGDGPSATSLGGTSHLSPGNSRDDSHPPFHPNRSASGLWGAQVTRSPPVPPPGAEHRHLGKLPPSNQLGPIRQEEALCRPHLRKASRGKVGMGSLRWMVTTIVSTCFSMAIQCYLSQH